MLSNRKKKYKMKKPLTPEEQERRRILREKREERKRLEKRKSLVKFFGYAGIFLLIAGGFCGFGIYDGMHDTDYFMYYFTAVLAAGALLCDNSGIRSFVFSRFPDRFFFSGWLRRPDGGQCRIVELCKTLSYYSVIADLFLLVIHASSKKTSFIIAAVWLICVLISVFYLIFDEYTAIRPDDTPKNGLSSAGETVLFTSLAMLIFTSENYFISKGFVIFAIVFIVVSTVLFLLISPTWHEHKDYIFLFILSVGAFAVSGYFTVNECFDFSEPQEYTVTVVDKDYFSGKNTTYTLYVEDWHGGENTVDVDVGRDTYRSIEIGERIVVKEYDGALGMEYYFYECGENI